MNRGPRNEEEWKKYSSLNIKLLETLPMAELVAINQVLEMLYVQGTEAMEKGEVPEDQKEHEMLYLDVTRKRIDIVSVAIFKKIETVFQIPKFK